MIAKTLEISAVAICLVALAGAACTSKTFHVETVVPASPDEVWSVLADTKSYPEWNPVFVAVEGDYVENGTVINSVRFPDGQINQIEGSVDRVSPGKELRQSGGVPGMLTYDHQWLLEPVVGGTKVVQHEVDRGLYLWFWDSSWIEPAYLSVNEALKERVLQLSN